MAIQVKNLEFFRRAVVQASEDTSSEAMCNELRRRGARDVKALGLRKVGGTASAPCLVVVTAWMQ